MALQKLVFEQQVELDSGLLIPASAAVGRVLTSDASGNATWATPATPTMTRGAGASVAFAAAASNSAVITHGLGSTPTTVLCTLTGNSGIALTTAIQVYAQTFTSTQFTCFISLGAAATGTLFFDWAAYA